MERPFLGTFSISATTSTRRGIEPSAAFRQAEMTPGTPNRSFATPTAPPPIASPVPAVITAWKGKTALLEAGLLGTIEAAVQASGDRVRDA